MPLSTLAIRNARPREKNWKLFDEKGLFLLITAKGSKLWYLKYRIDGKEKKLALGRFPEISAPQARALRDEARALLAKGKDPARIRKEQARARKLATENTFSAIARELIAKRTAEGISRATREKTEWLLSLLEPSIGSVPITDIKAPELLSVLQDIQATGRRETARRLRSFAGRVFDHAVVTGRAQHNPASSLRRALITPTVRHHPAIIEPVQLGKLLKAINTYTGYPSTVAALRISPHLFQRPGEIRTMRWQDIDLDARRWRMPEHCTKMRRQHEVPLSRQVIEIIASMEEPCRGSDFVFPAFHTPKKPISENAVNQALRRLGYGGVMTAHGFRSTASSLLNESNRWNPDAIERALAHQDSNQIRATYNRSSYWAERVEMMQWWSDHLDSLRAAAD